MLDVGAGTGNTACAIQGLDSPRLTLIDPAGKALDAADSRLIERDLDAQHDFTTMQTADTEAGRSFDRGTFDIVVSVASLHHHGELSPPMEVLLNLLSPGGLLLLADWHNTMWELPSRVRLLLEGFNWPDKKEDITRFLDMYTLLAEPTHEPSLAMRRANTMVCEFWRAHTECRTSEEPRFYLLEGHRPPEAYLTMMRRLGLNTDTVDTNPGLTANPLFLRPEASILAVTSGRKGI